MIQKKAVHNVDTFKGKQKAVIISELGIYEAIWNSRRDEAQEFKKWVKQVIKELRQATGLKGYEAFRMLDKEKQKEAMDNLKNGIEVISKKTIAKLKQLVIKQYQMCSAFLR